MTILLINLVQLAAGILTIAILADVFLSYFLPPYHKVRSILDRLLYPLLNPIRRFVPPIANIDFSPVILVFLIQIIEMLLVNLLSRFV